MLKFTVYFLLATALITGSVFLYGELKPDTHEEAPVVSTEEEEPEVIKVVPQDFPINELSDAWFGKEVVMENGFSDDRIGNPLSETASPLPEWLDQIISRESIVAFNQHILAQMPDELQFSQVAERKYTGTDGWEAFLVEFETNPSRKVISIMGAYKSETESYWLSEVLPQRVDMTLTQIAEEPEGAVLWGKKDGKEFRAVVKKETAVMATAQ